MIEILSTEPSLLEKINTITTHYSRESQLEKTKEELYELMDELENAININGYISLPGNTWSEVADVMIMCIQLAMQHSKEDIVLNQMEYKVNRQLKRIEEEIKYKGQRVKTCLKANVSVFQDGYIDCSIIDSVGCERCYEEFEVNQ